MLKSRPDCERILPTRLRMLQPSVPHPVPRRTAFRDRLADLRATPTGRRWLYVGAVIALAGLYYGAAKIGLRLAYLNGAVTALWPPVGVGIAALVLFGTRLWPGIVIGDLLVADFSTPFGTVMGQTVGNTLEVVVAAVLLRRLTGRRPAWIASATCSPSSRPPRSGPASARSSGRRRCGSGTSSPRTSSARSGGRGGCRTSRARSSSRR